MPRAIASRGEPKLTGSPSTRYRPSLGRWTPARIWIRVDFPAPLSPSRQVTWPAVHRHRDLAQRHHLAEALADPLHPQDRLAHRASDARRRMKLLTMTAATSMTPRKTWNQSASTPVITMPCCTMPKMSAPSTAPTAEP